MRAERIRFRNGDLAFQQIDHVVGKGIQTLLFVGGHYCLLEATVEAGIGCIKR
ncbi:hypothetical protein [Micromonospora fulviviridis]|uniref:hypothetical protein n=1 Tax=Micromonospora fulviviridis TaxID=47860 RepID=UPI0037AA980E